MPRTRRFSGIRRRVRIAWISGLAMFDRFADLLFGSDDAEAAMRSIDESSELMFERKIPAIGPASERMRIDYAIWKIGQQQKAIARLAADAQIDRLEAVTFSGNVGEDIGALKRAIQAFEAKFAAANTENVASGECHNALVEEVDELRTRMGEIEDRFSVRTNLLGQPSQN